jgi:hypothetical protein
MPTDRLTVPDEACAADPLPLLPDEFPLLLHAVRISAPAIPIAPNAAPALCLVPRLPLIVLCPDCFVIEVVAFLEGNSAGPGAHLD